MNRHLQAVTHNAPDTGRDASFAEAPGVGMGKTRRISVQFEPGSTAAASARNALLALQDLVEDGLLDDIRLLVSELVTNSVRHSDAEVGEALVHMDVMIGVNTIRVEVADTGNGFEPRPRDSDRTRPGGWGLYLVEQMADRWGVAREQLTRVWFEIDFDSRRERGQALAV